MYPKRQNTTFVILLFMLRTEYIICSDSFKGCLSSAAVNAAIAEGVCMSCPDAHIATVSISDGGEGFVSSVAERVKGEIQTLRAHDPLLRPLTASYLLADDGTAYIESAATCGIHLLQTDERNPLHTSSYGLGEMMADALQKRCTCMVIGLGGTCTSDNGQGMLRALHERLSLSGDMSAVSDAFSCCRVIMASDVDNPLLGPRGAAAVFAPQKGADGGMVEELECRAMAFVQQSLSLFGYSRDSEGGAGAAGGIGYALMQYLHAEKQSGIDMLLDLARFDTLLHPGTVVITGEGHADRQTLMGKAAYGVMQRARRGGAKVWLLTGGVDDKTHLLQAGFDAVIDINSHSDARQNPLHPDTARCNLKNAVIQQIKCNAEVRK